MNHLNEDMNELIINKQTLHKEIAEFNEHYNDMKEIVLLSNHGILSKLALLLHKCLQ